MIENIICFSSAGVPYIPPDNVQVISRSTDSVSVTWDRVEFPDYNIKYKLRYNTNFHPEWIPLREVSQIF